MTKRLNQLILLALLLVVASGIVSAQEENSVRITGLDIHIDIPEEVIRQGDGIVDPEEIPREVIQAGINPSTTGKLDT